MHNTLTLAEDHISVVIPLLSFSARPLHLGIIWLAVIFGRKQGGSVGSAGIDTGT